MTRKIVGVQHPDDVDRIPWMFPEPDKSRLKEEIAAFIASGYTKNDLVIKVDLGEKPGDLVSSIILKSMLTDGPSSVE